MTKSDLKLLLTPAQRQALRDLAHAQGVREQTVARDAVLAAIGRGGTPSAASPEVISSLTSLARQIDRVSRELHILLGHCKGDIDGEIDRDADAAVRQARGIIEEAGRSEGSEGET